MVRHYAESNKMKAKRSELNAAQSLTISTQLAFDFGGKSKTISLLPCGGDKPWRFLSDHFGIELEPVCDQNAIPITRLPICTRLEIQPVKWGCPDSLFADHPIEVAQMRAEHRSGKYELIDGNYTWEYWLEHYGKAELWHQFRTPEMERRWLSCRTGPGSTLSAFAGLRGRIQREKMGLIKYRADFYSGDDCQTIFLANCIKVPLTSEELRNSPSHLAKIQKLAAQEASIKSARRKINAQNARQPVSKTDVKMSLGVETDRGALAIFKRHGFSGWPETRGELDNLVKRHIRRKKTRSEALAKQNKERSANRRGYNSVAERKNFEKEG